MPEPQAERAATEAGDLAIESRAQVEREKAEQLAIIEIQLILTFH